MNLKLYQTMKENFKIKDLYKWIVLVVAVVFLYLFALNGRYEYMSGEAVLDKWKKEVVRAGTNELPVKYNGETIKQK